MFKISCFLLIFFSFSIQSNCREELSRILSETSKYHFRETVSGSNKQSRYMTIRSSVDGQDDIKMASLEYELTDDPNTIYIGLMYTQESYRSLGLQNLLVREMLSKHPKVKRIESLLVSTNEEVILRKIIESFIRADVKMNTFRPADRIEKQFESCCGDLFRSYTKQEQESLILEGLKNTPYYRTQRKLDLNLCSENPYDIQTSSYHGEFSITLAVSFCR